MVRRCRTRRGYGGKLSYPVNFGHELDATPFWIAGGPSRLMVRVSGWPFITVCGNMIAAVSAHVAHEHYWRLSHLWSAGWSTSEMDRKSTAKISGRITLDTSPPPSLPTRWRLLQWRPCTISMQLFTIRMLGLVPTLCLRGTGATTSPSATLRETRSTASKWLPPRWPKSWVLERMSCHVRYAPGRLAGLLEYQEVARDYTSWGIISWWRQKYTQQSHVSTSHAEVPLYRCSYA